MVRVKVNERWSFWREKWCWVLVEMVNSEKKKTKEPIVVEEETYHRTLEQVCSYIVDKDAGNAESMTEIKKIIKNTAKSLRNLIASKKGAVNE